MLISSYQAEKLINIRYIKTVNSGKHAALNIAFSDEDAKEWVFVVDSDDYLSIDCIDVLVTEIKSLPKNYHSIRIMQVDKSNVPHNNYFPNGLLNYLDLKNSGAKNDNADVFRKTALDGFKFPVFKGENFMAEGPLYNWLGLSGSTKFLNFKGYISEYLVDGLSDRSIMNRHRCFNSTLYLYENQYMCTQLKSIYKHKSAVNWWRFRMFKGPLERDFVMPIYYLPLGFALYLIDKVKNKVNN